MEYGFFKHIASQSQIIIAGCVKLDTATGEVSSRRQTTIKDRDAALRHLWRAAKAAGGFWDGVMYHRLTPHQPKNAKYAPTKAKEFCEKHGLLAEMVAYNHNGRSYKTQAVEMWENGELCWHEKSGVLCHLYRAKIKAPKDSALGAALWLLNVKSAPLTELINVKLPAKGNQTKAIVYQETILRFDDDWNEFHIDLSGPADELDLAVMPELLVPQNNKIDISERDDMEVLFRSRRPFIAKIAGSKYPATVIEGGWDSDVHNHVYYLHVAGSEIASDQWGRPYVNGRIFNQQIFFPQ